MCPVIEVWSSSIDKTKLILHFYIILLFKVDVHFLILKNTYPDRNGASANHYPPPKKGLQSPNPEKGINKINY